jgi:hypothetical protein
MKGYVYVLTNESMPGIVKIGRTTRDVSRRAEELWQSGVPTPFKVHGFVLSPNCHELEATVHGSLAGHRVHPGREFFRCDADRVVTTWLEFQVGAMLEEYLPDWTMIHKETKKAASTPGFIPDE